MKPNKIPPTKKANSIHNLFYDPKQGLQNAKALYEKAQELEIDMSRKDVQTFYDKQLVNQLMKPVRKPSQLNQLLRVIRIIYGRWTSSFMTDTNITSINIYS